MGSTGTDATARKSFEQRMDADLAQAATAIAEELGISRNEFINRLVRGAVLSHTKPTPVGEGTPAQYELALRFYLAGTDADERAYRLLAQVEGLADLVGATDATPGLVRLATMQARAS